MKKEKFTNRMLALAMSLCMIFTMMPMSAHATTHEHDDTCGYSAASECTHTHNSTCGYAEAVAGSDCTHSCTDGNCSYSAGSNGNPCNHTCDFNVCGYYEAIPGTPCNDDCPFSVTGSHNNDCNYSEGEPGSPCNHSHDASCGFVEPTSGTVCDHQHDTNCGFAEGVEAQSCTHEHDADCGFSEGSECTYVEPEHTCEWGEWVSNNDGTHTRTCVTDASHTETASCATYSYAMVEGQPYHNILCECMYVLDTEDHTMSDWYSDEDGERRDCTKNCDYFETRSIDTHTHDWKYRSVNEERHEPYCTGCEEVGIQSVHTYGDDGICTVCGHTQHTHNWEYRIVNESRHEPYCTGCEETGLQGMHTYGDDGACTACGYAEHTHNWEYRIVNESRHEPYCTECEETGLQGMHTWKYVPYGANTHQEVCTVCGYVGEKLLHENNNPDEDCSCDICGEVIYSEHDIQEPTCVSGWSDTRRLFLRCSSARQHIRQ